MAETTSAIPLAKPKKKKSYLMTLVSRFIHEKPLGTVGAAIVILLLLTGIFANFLAPHGYNEINLTQRLQPSSPSYIMGTDDLGRDVFSRVIYGARISMVVGLGAASLMIVIALTIGMISGFLGGKFDLIMQRFVDSWMCLPRLFIILTIMSLTGPGILQLIVVMGLMGGIAESRVIRGAVINLKQNVYIEASKAIGVSTPSVLARHILPNIMAPVIILFTIAVGRMILQEATVSFLGFGVPPPVPSWGSMLSEEGRDNMFRAPWLAIWPGVALSFAVYGINMFGDALRDLLDPRLKGGLGRYGGVKMSTMKKKLGLT